MSGDDYYYWSTEHGRWRCVDHPVGMLPNVPFYLPPPAPSLVNYNNYFRFHAIGQRYPVTAGTFNSKFTVDEGNKMEIIIILRRFDIRPIGLKVVFLSSLSNDCNNF